MLVQVQALQQRVPGPSLSQIHPLEKHLINSASRRRWKNSAGCRSHTKSVLTFPKRTTPRLVNESEGRKMETCPVRGFWLLWHWEVMLLYSWGHGEDSDSGSEKPVSWEVIIWVLGFPDGAGGKEPTCQCKRHERCGSIPGLGRFPGEGNGNPLQYSCLENSKANVWSNSFNLPSTWIHQVGWR